MKKNHSKLKKAKIEQLWSAAIILGLAMLISGVLELLIEGVPLGLTYLFHHMHRKHSRIDIICYCYANNLHRHPRTTRVIVEKRFSVEFLMASQVWALYLGLFFEAATVLFLYTAEYFEGYIQQRARKTVEKLSKFIPKKPT